MARNKCLVLLGYEDEIIEDINKSQTNFLTNKIGGLPDWPNSELNVLNCPVCNSARPLILQIYAPLSESSQYHRNLYVFGCFNPVCSVKSKSWLCMRVQTFDKTQLEENLQGAVNSIKRCSNNESKLWCSGADDWGDLDGDLKEENGNVLKVVDNYRYNLSNTGNAVNVSYDDDEDDEDSASMENDIVNNFANINMDDKNANCGAQASVLDYNNVHNIEAEIEGEESEIVSVETPIKPQRDLLALLNQTSSVPFKVKSTTLKSFYIYVDEERNVNSNNANALSDHVRELIQDYQSQEDKHSCSKSGANSPPGPKLNEQQELYERSIPAHGDVMFHKFLTEMQKNPGQILRYSRDNCPLLIGPITEIIPKCQYCGGEVICEAQILPTLISKLRLLENGELAPIEYGNVLIFTCLKSCWDTPDKMRYETVIVQQEP